MNRGDDVGSGLSYLPEPQLEALAAALAAAVCAPRAQSMPERDDENVEPGHLADPLEPRKGHRPRPNEPLPLDAPPVPKLRPLE